MCRQHPQIRTSSSMPPLSQTIELPLKCVEGRWRGKGRGDGSGWRLNECVSVSNVKETAQLQGRGWKIGRRGGWWCRKGGREGVGKWSRERCIWWGYPFSSYLCVHQQQGRGVFGFFIWMAVELVESGGALHSSGGGAFHGALRKQALDERCEDGPVITALCGTCLCWIWLTSPSYSPLTSGATLLSFSLPPPLTSASPLLSDKEARERGEVKHKEQRDVRWKCQHIYLCSGNGSSHGLSWQRPLQKVTLKMGHEWAKFPVIK